MRSFPVTTKEFTELVFTQYEGNPIVKHTPFSTVIADPSILTPAETHDGKWYMFCHTLYNVVKTVSDDGVNFSRPEKVLPRGMRPNINRIGGKYYLYYERTQPLLPKAISMVGGKWYSEIYLTTSDDLVSWSKPIPIITKEKPYHTYEKGTSISNPFLTEIGEKYRLYYSAGLTYLEDCRFCEPTCISYAESDIPDGNFISQEKPVITPDVNDPGMNRCAGCIKIYRVKDGYIGLQDGIYRTEKGDSMSAIRLLASEDGKKFKFVKNLVEPGIFYERTWMAQYVYACDLVYFDGKFRIYFNARDKANPLSGRENIGFTEAVLSK